MEYVIFCYRLRIIIIYLYILPTIGENNQNNYAPCPQNLIVILLIPNEYMCGHPVSPIPFSFNSNYKILII